MKIFPTLLLLSISWYAYSAKKEFSVTILIQNTLSETCTIEVIYPLKHPSIDPEDNSFIHFKQLATAQIEPGETQEITYTSDQEYNREHGPWGSVYAYPSSDCQQATKNTNLPSRCVMPKEHFFEISEYTSKDIELLFKHSTYPIKINTSPLPLKYLCKNRILKDKEHYLLQDKVAFENLIQDLKELLNLKSYDQEKLSWNLSKLSVYIKKFFNKNE